MNTKARDKAEAKARTWALEELDKLDKLDKLEREQSTPRPLPRSLFGLIREYIREVRRCRESDKDLQSLIAEKTASADWNLKMEGF